MKTTGTDIDKLMPPVSRFAGRSSKKQAIIEKLTAFFEKYHGIGRRFETTYPSLEEDEVVAEAAEEE